ncbi:MAG: polymer-forming cytoskeletal protein [Lachnospiraceae bacterium]|nr:polymer-forming cytoskeletal protein [Lachnospiraceae bacterium]
MLENTEDAKALEPEANALENMDLNEAVESAINSKNEEESDDYEEAGMADIEEKINEEETTAQKEQEANSILADDTTYITKGTTIKGNIETDGGIDVIGTVEGDVKCGGKLIIGGTVTGNIDAGEIYANAAKLKGEIVSEGSVKIGVGTVVVGNVSATSAVIAGAVNGDIDVKGPVIVDSTAVIMGDIKSRSVQINNGAVIEGRCSQCYSEIDVKSFFE